jgi:hypothetical protein
MAGGLAAWLVVETGAHEELLGPLWQVQAGKGALGSSYLMSSADHQRIA